MAVAEASLDYTRTSQEIREIMDSPAINIESVNLTLTDEPVGAWDHYQAHRDEYELIQNRLGFVRERFLRTDPEVQIEWLQKAYTFAAISVQTPLPIHEAAYVKLWAGDPLETVGLALRSVNYNQSKEAAITRMLPRTDLWTELAGLLEAGEIDGAHQSLLRNVTYVSTAKAPFTLAMLGFTEKMCIDANVLNALGIRGRIETKSVGRYEEFCRWVRSRFSSLDAELPPFLVQWVIFDTVRGEVAHHDVWFESLEIE